MMTASDLVKAKEAFPTITGDIVQDTDTVISELAVGNYVVERGLARLYMIWKTKSFLGLTTNEYSCQTCKFVFTSDEDVAICPRCNSDVLSLSQVPIHPTLESYLSHISDMTGKSRQTLFNRLKVYRVLCDERGATGESVFELIMLSSGAASKLAAADDDDPSIALENNSWQETINVALSQDSKSAALEYVSYDVLRQTKITSVIKEATMTGTVYREYYVDDEKDEYVLEGYNFVLDGEWPDQVLDWFSRRIGAKVE